MILEDKIQHSACLANVVDKSDSMVMNVNKAQGKEFFKGKRCEYCHFTGHTKDHCYKLIGYPSDWKLRKKAGYGNKNTTGGSGGYGGMNTTGGSGGFGGHHVANNVSSNSSNSYDQSQVASTSQGEGDSAHLAKAQTFTEKEYK